MTLVQFQPLASQPSPGFWSALTAHKLNHLKLDQSLQRISGWIEEGREVIDRESLVPVGIDGGLSLGEKAFENDSASASRLPFHSVGFDGSLKIFNTVEEFRQTALKKQVFDDLVNSMISSFSSDKPVFNQFLLVVFADLKRYEYHYWFAFPALFTSPGWSMMSESLSPVDPLDIEEIRQKESSYKSLNNLPSAGLLAFLVKGVRGQREIAPISTGKAFYNDVKGAQVTIAFHDPSSSTHHPGWPLRNVLYYLNQVHAVTSVMVYCLRGGSSSRSAVLDITTAGSEGVFKSAGWEKNHVGKLASRMASLAPLMSPTQLAEQAVDLNLKLMKWRIMPSLDLEILSQTRCLLLGAGTLGCYVARMLMGWGVRNITFVDSGKVSFSNPVRQPLFDFTDCLEGGAPKAECAALKLRQIFPGMNSAGHSLEIPMPGHPVPEHAAQKVEADVAKIVELFKSHDAVFLLTDSRESRWLPTVLGAAYNKLVINAALGFDSYLVMRHGTAVKDNSTRLGCYYCNDVVAPMDSLTDRTLDQMCTVTRPGVAPIAAATAVELLVSLLQHPTRDCDILDDVAKSKDIQHLTSILGLIPHQLRGTLSQWKTLLITGAAFDRCTGCSKLVLDAYQSEGVAFLMRVFNDAQYLERLTGLDRLHSDSEAVMSSLDWDDSSDDDPLL